jgi:hypothetical protein
MKLIKKKNQPLKDEYMYELNNWFCKNKKFRNILVSTCFTCWLLELVISTTSKRILSSKFIHLFHFSLRNNFIH